MNSIYFWTSIQCGSKHVAGLVINFCFSICFLAFFGSEKTHLHTKIPKIKSMIPCIFQIYQIESDRNILSEYKQQIMQLLCCAQRRIQVAGGRLKKFSKIFYFVLHILTYHLKNLSCFSFISPHPPSLQLQLFELIIV